MVGQVFVERRDENEKMYYWPGVRAGDILSGKVKVPLEAALLQQSLQDAETGRAQRQRGAELEFEEDMGEIMDEIELSDGEVLRLPPTPGQVEEEEREEERKWREEDEKAEKTRMEEERARKRKERLG